MSLKLKSFAGATIVVIFLKILLGAGEMVSAKKGDDLKIPFYFEDPHGFLLEDNFYLIGIEAESQKLEGLEKFERLPAILTGYSSSPEETDETPNITASGSEVEDGICANNLLPLGTKVKFPEVFGEKIFVVKDRMAPQKSPFHFDIWFPDKESALNFGAKITEVVILPF